MNKNIISICALAIFMICGLVNLKAQSAEEAKGKLLFKDNKCSSCHGIESQGFVKKGKSSVPDLSTVGDNLKADFLVKYLKKNETQNDMKHPVSFKGSDEDLTVLVEWLTSLKKVK